ncbi:MAG: transposase, partial [Halobacteria archaeon]
QQCLVHVNRRIQRFEVEKGMEPRPLRRSEPPRFTRAGRPCHEFIRFIKKLRRILRDAIDFHESVEGPRRRRQGADRFERRLDRLIDREHRDPHADQLAGGLRKCRHQMFTFLRYPGVPWHSNGVEREIRPMVVVRNNTHGSKSQAGAETTTVLVSVKESCRRSGRNFIKLLERTLSRCARGRPVG